MPVVMSVVLGLDRLTKYLVVSRLELYEAWAPIPALGKVLTIHYVTNTGAAFGLFQNANLFFVIVGIVVSLAIVVYHRFVPDRMWLIRLSLGLQLGGALGNLIDRLTVGHVIDFVDLQIWPVFNVADSSIVCGAILLALLILREERLEQRERGRLESADGPEQA
ncbi:MAG: signal peptidase II [Anaerolineae bacterium]|nr:signal peptidase II [Anaerolineae bacterium]